MRLVGKKILITSGPTWIPVDDMRIISNRSSGRLGRIASEEFIKNKAKVTLLEGPVSNTFKNNAKIKILKFCFYNEFLKLFDKEIKKKYDIIIHAAAVSDYKLKKPFKSKLSSKLKSLTLNLIPTEKIIKKVKRTNVRTFLVGFKMESNLSKNNIKKKTIELFIESECDLVIANTVKNEKYTGYILDKNYNIVSVAKNRKEAIKKLIHKIKTI